MTPQIELNLIDKRIDAVHRELCRREAVGQLSARSWQMAWDKHGDLRRRNRKLYDRRYDAQVAHDTEVAREATRKQRAENRAFAKASRARFLASMQCPACSAALPNLIDRR